MKNKLHLVYLSAIISFLFCPLYSCKHETLPPPTTVKKWDNILMKTIYEIPAPPNRTEEGELFLELLSDNSLKFDFHIHNLTPGDVLTAAHVHPGDAGTAGGVLINFAPTFVGGGATGTVANLRQGQIDTLLTMPVYFNVHSTQFPGGLVRGQLDKKIEFAMDIPLSGTNEVPAVSTTATGLATLRLTDDKTLYSTITVSNLESDDTLNVAHIHRGATGINGPVRIFLAASLADFGVQKTAQLPDSLYAMLRNDATYVNAHTRRRPGGKVRGQIRN